VISWCIVHFVCTISCKFSPSVCLPACLLFFTAHGFKSHRNTNPPKICSFACTVRRNTSTYTSGPHIPSQYLSGRVPNLVIPPRVLEAGSAYRLRISAALSSDASISTSAEYLVQTGAYVCLYVLVYVNLMCIYACIHRCILWLDLGISLGVCATSLYT